MAEFLSYEIAPSAFCGFEIIPKFAPTIDRGVAQPGLEYSSGGRGVGSSNLLTPTMKQSHRCESDGGFCVSDEGQKLAFVSEDERRKRHAVPRLCFIGHTPKRSRATKWRVIYSPRPFYNPTICYSASWVYSCSVFATLFCITFCTEPTLCLHN